MIPFAAILASLLLFPDPDARQIIQRHEDALSRLHSVRLAIDSRRSTDGGATWSPMSQTTVVKSGRRERFHEVIYGSSYAGQWRNALTHRDLAYNPTEFRIMTGLDPQRGPNRSPSGGARLDGAIWPPVPLGPHGRNVGWTRSLLFICGSSPLRTLHDRAKRRSMKSTRAPDGGEEFVFSLVDADPRTDQEITLSATHNYAVSRLRSHYKGDAEAGFAPSRGDEHVVEFHDYDFGLSIPRFVHATSETDPEERLDRLVSVESINVAIPDAELELAFLPGTRVNDFVSHKFYIWGEGKPANTFATGREMSEWLHREDEKAQRSMGRGIPVGTLLAFGGLTAALVVLFALRSRMSRSRAADPCRRGEGAGTSSFG